VRLSYPLPARNPLATTEILCLFETSLIGMYVFEKWIITSIFNLQESKSELQSVNPSLCTPTETFTCFTSLNLSKYSPRARHTIKMLFHIFMPLHGIITLLTKQWGMNSPARETNAMDKTRKNLVNRKTCSRAIKFRNTPSLKHQHSLMPIPTSKNYKKKSNQCPL
jgi:hypothetical protein